MRQLNSREFPKSQQLSLAGLELYYVDYDAARAYVIDLAHRRLRRALSTSGRISLLWHEATRIADPDLLHTLHCYGKVQCVRECPPWVVYVS